MRITESVENYLETIHILSLKKPEVHAVDICNHLGYSRPTVSIVLRQLRINGLVTVDEDNHIHLTQPGLAVATRMYERHRILTKMFISLGVRPEQAQIDACKVEHDLSDETFDAICRHYRNSGSPNETGTVAGYSDAKDASDSSLRSAAINSGEA